MRSRPSVDYCKTLESCAYGSNYKEHKLADKTKALTVLDEAITTIREALAQQQEPVAWGVDWDSKGACCTIVKRYGHGVDEILAVEYAPPKREWQGLTIGELSAFYDKHAKCQEEGMLVSGWLDFARTIEAKLKEKNT